MNRNILQRYAVTKGLDLKSSDLNRDFRFASAMANAQYRKSGAVEKRRGYQMHSAHANGFGMFNYKYVDENDQPQEMVLSLGRNLHKENFTEISVSYGGAEASAFLTLFFDSVTDQYRCQIVAGLNQVLDFPLGQGFDEVSPVTIAQLATAINAVPNFTATATGDTTVPAAFIKIVRDIDTKAQVWVGQAAYWTTVNSLITNPFDGSYTRRNNLDFENISAVNLNNVCYLSNGYDYLYKFDGQNLYRAGIPKPATVTSALGAAGAITGTNYVHRAQYVQYDNGGNIIEGNILAVSTALNPVAQKMDITIANILAGTGFNLNAAMVVGAQVAVNTINVDNGAGGAQSLQVGDTAYFFDSISAGYVERKVTARTNATLTVAGAAVTVADNAPISNNLRISIQRNKTSGITPTVFYELVEVPNNPFVATQVYTDNITDAAVGALVDPPATDRSLPPKGKYLFTAQNLLFVLGNPDDQYRVSWSDIDSPEYFPADVNQEKIQSKSGDVLRGGGQNGSFVAVFTKTSTHVGSGTFGDGNYRFEERAANIGCSSHSSIVDVEGILAWWSDRGPYNMSNGQMPQAIGLTSEGEGRISPVMDQPGYEYNPSFQPLFYRSQRVVGINWLQENKILFYVPCESLNGSDRYPNSNSRVFAYDYTRDAWLEWNNMNMIAGACLYKNEFYFKGRRLSPATTILSELMRIHNLNDAYDYEDNVEAISWDYAPQWEALNQPGTLKTFLKLQLYSLEEVQNNNFTITVKQEINYQKDAAIASFSLTLTGSGYGQSPYGTDPYGDPANPTFEHDLARTKTKSIRTRFTNEEHQQNCVISGWDYLCVGNYRVEFKT